MDELLQKIHIEEKKALLNFFEICERERDLGFFVKEWNASVKNYCSYCFEIFKLDPFFFEVMFAKETTLYFLLFCLECRFQLILDYEELSVERCKANGEQRWVFAEGEKEPIIRKNVQNIGQIAMYLHYFALKTKADPSSSEIGVFLLKVLEKNAKEGGPSEFIDLFLVEAIRFNFFIDSSFKSNIIEKETIDAIYKGQMDKLDIFEGGVSYAPKFLFQIEKNKFGYFLALSELT